MTDTQFDIMKVTAHISEQPIKLTKEASPEAELLEIMNDAKASLTAYTEDTRGTCMDERRRTELKSGKPAVEVRPSLPGGPDVYLLAMRELTGYHEGQDLTANERAHDSKITLDNEGILSGGHEECAADNLLGTWAGQVIVDNQAAIAEYTHRKFDEAGLEFDMNLMNQVFEHAADIQASGRYAEWSEESYFDLLGAEAGEAIEKLEHAPHLGKMMIWVDIEGQTIDQTKIGNRAFELNLPYMKRVENAGINGPAAELVPYARYAIIGALAAALPNEELQEGMLSA